MRWMAAKASIWGDEFAQCEDALVALGRDLIAIDYEHEVLDQRARRATEAGGHEAAAVLFYRAKRS